MSIFRIPLRSGVDNSSYTQRTALDGRDYILRFQWNQREAYWYLSVADQDDAMIAAGIKLVADYGLLKRARDARRPPGEIVCVDLTGGDADPGLTSLGTTHDLFYFDAEELGR